MVNPDAEECTVPRFPSVPERTLPGWPIVLGLMLSAACSDDIGRPTSELLPPERPWQIFEINTLKSQRASQGLGYMEFLNEPAASMGLYHLAAGAVDGQSAHGQDEVYYVLNGSAEVDVEGNTFAVEGGTAVFVKTGADHSFHSITQDLDVLVIFAKATADPDDPSALVFSASEMVAQRNPSQNVWDMFMTAATMTLGMYMLPQSLGGDAQLTHTFDEINIVVDGGGSFSIGEDTIDVGAGDIVYVGAGASHRFHALTGDTDVLIWWERQRTYNRQVE